MRLMLILLLAFQDKAPVPAANEIREAEKEIRSLYKADYADTTAAGRQRLNEKLLRTAGEKDVPAATRYALLNEALVGYVQIVQTAFRETHDALVGNRTYREALAAQGVRRNHLARALELADLRYRSGYSSYLEVLDSQRELLEADTLRIAAARDARIALVDLARALGGGWSPDTVADAGTR